MSRTGLSAHQAAYSSATTRSGGCTGRRQPELHPVPLRWREHALVAEYDYSGNLVSRYVHGANSGADDPLVWFDGNTSRRDLHADHQGTIIAVTDAAGSPLAIDSYDESGIPGAGNLARERFQYTGQTRSPRSACIITRRGSTLRRWGGSYRPTRSDMRVESTSTNMWVMIRLTLLTQVAHRSNRIPAPTQEEPVVPVTTQLAEFHQATLKATLYVATAQLHLP